MAFKESHRGWSTDFVLCDDQLLDSFDSTLQHLTQSESITVGIEEGRRKLLALRKSGGLGSVTTRRKNFSHDDYKYVAETVSRIVEDQFETKIDSIFCNPEKRKHFDNLISKYCLTVSPTQIRLAAFGLRKSGQLPPLVATNLTAAPTILDLLVAEIVASNEIVPKTPGVYVFHDQRRALYVGEASNLYNRVAKTHCIHSDRMLLAQHLWQNDPEEIHVEIRSYAGVENAQNKSFRRALEKELIDTRHPAFNLQ